MSQDETTDTTQFPCPVCGQFFSRSVESTNHMSVTEANLLCPDGHAWSMRWVSPQLAVSA